MNDSNPEQGRKPSPDRDEPGPEKPGDENLDKGRTPGDGTLDGGTPAGLTSDELRKRAEDDQSTEPGTG